mgnify:CR=1 FL=1
MTNEIGVLIGCANGFGKLWYPIKNSWLVGFRQLRYLNFEAFRLELALEPRKPAFFRIPPQPWTIKTRLVISTSYIANQPPST